MTRRWGIWSLGLVVVLVMIGATLYGLRRVRGQTPLTITGPNILPNNDFSINADNDDMPDGWSRGATGVQLGKFVFEQPPQSLSMQLLGVNNYLQSPFIASRPDAEYRVAFRALSDSSSATAVRVFFHWRDADGVDFSVVRGEAQSVPKGTWSVISAAAIAPADAAQVAISIRPVSDDRVYIDDLSMGQVGVRVQPWPAGKRAALAFSFDYETAMGGLIHSKSADAALTAEARGLAMREGASTLLELFAPGHIRATFYTNGYNFLIGNSERKEFMGNPLYDKWAKFDAEKGFDWETDRWQTTRWFADDPYTTEAQAPAWYFGSQIEQLKQADQDIQSHTFAHFHGGHVTPDDWRADFKAWNEVAAERGVEPATSLAFPWSSSAGLGAASWDVIAEQGIRSITRTVWREGQGRSWLADRVHFALRRVPRHPEIAVIADVYLLPSSRDDVLRAMRQTLLNEGAIDVWAHTEEVTSPEQVATWQAVIDAARQDFWIAPVPEIVQYAADIQQVRVEVLAEQPSYQFRVHNDSPHALRDVTLTLPFVPERVELDGTVVSTTGTLLLIDLERGQSLEITLQSQAASGIAPLQQREAAWHG